MLQVHADERKILTHGFIIAVEVEEGVSLESVMEGMLEGIRWKEGVGKAEVDYFGEITFVPEEEVVIEVEEVKET